MNLLQWHANGTGLKSNGREVLANHLGLQFQEQKIPGTEYTTDGNLAAIVIPAAIRECKNEHGDPLNQAILHYSNFVRKIFESPLKFHNCDSRFPCILLIDMGTAGLSSTIRLFMVYSGSYLGFYGAVWDGERARVEPLTVGFDLATHWRETKARASSFDALALAVQNIEAHYQRIRADA
jgi:hypothetical protein